MPKATVEEEQKWKLPEGVALPCVLKSVEEQTIPYRDKKTGEEKTFTKWTWDFEIVDGEYAGLHIWADTDPKVTSHPDNKPRQFYEALTGVALEVGQGLDTDDLLGLPAAITVRNITGQKRNGEPFYKSELDQIFPIDAAPESNDPWAPNGRLVPEDPPF